MIQMSEWMDRKVCPYKKMDPIDGFHVMTALAIDVINSDPFLTQQEKEDMIKTMKDKVGFEEHNGFYYIPTGVWD